VVFAPPSPVRPPRQAATESPPAPMKRAQCERALGRPPVLAASHPKRSEDLTNRRLSLPHQGAV
jgi:hypothetical protein